MSNDLDGRKFLTHIAANLKAVKCLEVFHGIQVNIQQQYINLLFPQSGHQFLPILGFTHESDLGIAGEKVTYAISHYFIIFDVKYFDLVRHIQKVAKKTQAFAPRQRIAQKPKKIPEST